MSIEEDKEIEVAHKMGHLAGWSDGKSIAHARTDITAEVRLLRQVLSDLMSWFPARAAPAEWRLQAGEWGADGAIEAARAALREEPSET